MNEPVVVPLHPSPAANPEARELLAVTERMLVHAGNAEWDSVQSLQHERVSLMMAALAEPVKIANAPILREVLALNEQIAHYVREARGEVTGKIVNLHRTRDAAGSYEQVARN